MHASTSEGIDGDEPLPHSRPPRREITALVERYLGPGRRAGRGVLPPLPAETERGVLEAEVYRAAGFTGPVRLEVPGHLVLRDADDVVASVFSLSSAAPHLFGELAAPFETDLRKLLTDVSPDGRFAEQMRSTAVDVWRPSPG